MRLAFAGTPAPAVPTLRALHEAGHEIVSVVTRTDAPVGRKRVLTPSPVAQAAAELGYEALRADRLDEEATARITAAEPELGVIVAYGGLVREPLLSAPRHGWINLHFSLLPRWRGAAPVQRALIAGDHETGAAVFRLVPELDAGDVYGRLTYRVPPLATASDVLTDLADAGSRLVVDVVAAVGAGTAVAVPQTGEASYAEKLSAEDGRLRWDEPADRVLDRIRGTTPEPGAFTTVDGARLKILAAHRAESAPALRAGAIASSGREVVVGTATDPIALERVQPAGKGPMAAADWWRGLRIDDPVAGL